MPVDLRVQAQQHVRCRRSIAFANRLRKPLELLFSALSRGREAVVAFSGRGFVWEDEFRIRILDLRPLERR